MPIQKPVLRKELIRVVVGGILALLAIKGFFDTSAAYDNFKIALGVGISDVHPSELVFYIWYAFFGAIAILGFTVALCGTGLLETLSKTFGTISRYPAWFVGGAMAMAFALVLCCRLFVLQDAPVSDDESTYIFIAKTLLHGRLVNPVPEGAEFLRNQFIIVNEHGWYGKYPIGHPLVLALGIATHTLVLVGPMLAAATILLTYLVGKKTVGTVSASLGILLLLFSPHFIFTWATLLSQTTSTVCMLLGIYTLIRLRESKMWYWALFTGVSWGFGVLVRPMPGALFLLIAAMVFFFPSKGIRFSAHMKNHFVHVLIAALPILAVASILFLTNLIQTGDFFVNAYHMAHGGQNTALSGMAIGGDSAWQKSLSIGASGLRQAFWLLGTPFVFVLIVFTRVKQYGFLLVGLIVQEYVYRYIAAKTCVASTGPIYVTEIVPLLVLLVASAIVVIKEKWQQKMISVSSKWIPAAVLSSVLTALICFWPIQMVTLHKGAEAWLETESLLKANGIKKAVVLTNANVLPGEMKTWAYFPPNNSPSLDDDIIYLRLPRDGSMESLIALWRRKYSDRPIYTVRTQDHRRVLFKYE